MKSLDGFVFASHGLKVERMDFFEFLFFIFWNAYTMMLRTKGVSMSDGFGNFIEAKGNFFVNDS